MMPLRVQEIVPRGILITPATMAAEVLVMGAMAEAAEMMAVAKYLAVIMVVLLNNLRL